ncbi:NAD(P)/FAD-dependent oxidoreductase [bacterium]|nr:NAD(P)/FAD-dependent oxidoreductase [bacterium]
MFKKFYDVIVIGGGASGMFAAGCAAAKGADTLLLEKTNQLGNKLSITGKGRCNLTNIGEVNDFIESYGKNGKFLYRSFKNFFNQSLIAFFNSYGIETKVERGGRIFPVSDNSESIVNALRNYLKENKVTLGLNLQVKEIVLGDNKTDRNNKVIGIKLSERKEIIKTDKVILATGGLSYPKTGATGDGYRMAKKLGHSIVSLTPALVPLETKEDFVKDLQGLALKNVSVTVFTNGRKIGEDFGEMLFTHFGLSGPIILKMSSLVIEHLNKNQEVSIVINFKPALDEKKLADRLLRETKNFGLKSVNNVMKNFLPRKLVPVFLKLANINTDKKFKQITHQEKEKIINLLTNFSLKITKSRPIDEAIITKGGISLKEINPYTMESKKIKGLYFCGEIIDLDGKTGGYNLQLAFSTAHLAAQSAFNP